MSRTELLDQARRAITSQGWSVTAAGGQLPYAYTAGLTPHGHPELGITGLMPYTAHSILNQLASRVIHKQLPLQHDLRVPDILAGGYEVIIKAVTPHSRLWPAVAFALYGKSQVRLQQVVYPDAQHRYPWQPGCTVAQLQPLLAVEG